MFWTRISWVVLVFFIIWERVSTNFERRSMVAWSTAGEEPVWLWTVRTRKDGTWSAKVLPHHNKDMKLEAGVDAVAVAKAEAAPAAEAPAASAEASAAVAEVVGEASPHPRSVAWAPACAAVAAGASR